MHCKARFRISRPCKKVICMACIYGLYGAIHGILGAIYGCCTLMWYHTWCHVWYHIWCGTCEIRKDAHVTTMYDTIYELIETCEIRKDAHVTSTHGTMYELAFAKYGTTQMSFSHMAPCMNWHLRNMERRKCHSHIWHHVWNGTCDIRKDAHVTSKYGTLYEMALAKYGTTQCHSHVWHHVWNGTCETVEGRTSNFHIWHHVWSGTSAAFLPNEVHRQF